MKLTKAAIYSKEQATDMDGTAKVPSRLVVDVMLVMEKYACRPCSTLGWSNECPICPVSRVTDELAAVLPAKREEARR